LAIATADPLPAPLPALPALAPVLLPLAFPLLLPPPRLLLLPPPLLLPLPLPVPLPLPPLLDDDESSLPLVASAMPAPAPPIAITAMTTTGHTLRGGRSL
jgi:hypothetical protein